MGNIDDAVPFFGKGFNKVYPLIMVIYTILIANNFFDRVINYFGNWEIFRSRREASDDLDGFDPSGLIILQKGKKTRASFDFFCLWFCDTNLRAWLNSFGYLCSQNDLGFNKGIK